MKREVAEDVTVVPSATKTEHPVSGASAVMDDAVFHREVSAIAENVSIETMLETVCLATGVRFAAIARVTEHRWITCKAIDYLDFGLRPGDELVVETTLCHEVRQCAHEIIIDDASADPLYKDHHTPRQYGFRSYLSIPIYRKDGTFFGTLCALDPKPNQLSDARILKMVRLFAKMVGDTLEVEETLVATRAELSQNLQIVEVQEKFMAILAHDLRNPASAIRSGLRLLGKTAREPRQVELLAMMDASAHRMTDLVNNLMDHARNKLGGGIILARDSDGSLKDTLNLIVAEIRTISPAQDISISFDLPDPVNCDRARIAQLLSNLLGNAIIHGSPGRPVSVSANVVAGVFRLAVTNEGHAIPEAQIPDLFAPFRKGNDRSSREGLGLGLYIAAEIAKAHGGTIAVSSDASATTFVFAMPVDQNAGGFNGA